MPSLVHLSRLTRRLAEIPYENVTKILARERGAPAFPVFEGPLSSDAGGTCFAATRHAWELLSASGYEVYPVMADRTYGLNTHCALIVAVEGKKYLVDPGFLLPLPVELEGGRIFTGFNYFSLLMSSPPRAKCAGGDPVLGESERGVGSEKSTNVPTTGFPLSRFTRGENDRPSGTIEAYTEHLGTWKFRHRFRDQPVSWEEFFRHWRSSFNWSSMNSVVITALRDFRQIYLHDRHLRIIERDRVIRSTITPIDLPGVAKLFGIGESLIQDAFEVTGSFNHDRAVGRAHRSLVESTVEEKDCS